MIIYKATNKINGKIYIGQTSKSLEERKKRHGWESKKYFFPNALKKYGKDNFKWEIIEYCNSKEELDEMEFHYIKQYGSFGKNGYNLTLGGEGVIGRICSDETRKKMSEAHKGKKRMPFTEEHKRRISESRIGPKNPNYGVPMPNNVKKILIDINKNRIVSEETRNKMSVSHKALPSMSYVTRKKISESHKGKKHSEATKIKIRESMKKRNKNKVKV